MPAVAIFVSNPALISLRSSSFNHPTQFPAVHVSPSATSSAGDQKMLAAAAASSGCCVESSYQIIQDEKFYDRLLSKETSPAFPSFRVYYGGASGAVPFLWESQPGTPKHPMASGYSTAAGAALPPLTPPPSHSTVSSKKKNKKKAAGGRSKRSLISAVLPKLLHRKLPPPVFSSVSSSSSSFSSANSVGDNDVETGGGSSPTSTLCFGERRAGGRGWLGCYSRLLSIAGHGFGRRTPA
ncbi:alkylated DNA repair protein [Apostasia shenzhenica]|uniref:Alkylated DNA repair protein n=1 Tax=Apostasia shenzhenica TaxID=1088818 RepID=A0A2I0BGG6_9ASPA|nr:alkylated DNA repair protein [Apostasia shenzhenica]